MGPSTGGAGTVFQSQQRVAPQIGTLYKSAERNAGGPMMADSVQLRSTTVSRTLTDNSSRPINGLRPLGPPSCWEDTVAFHSARRRYQPGSLYFSEQPRQAHRTATFWAARQQDRAGPAAQLRPD